MEAGQLTLSLGDYAMGEVVHAVVSAVESLAAGKKLAFKAIVPADLPPGRGDERRLTQVLLNLAGNAIKFTDVGEVSIEARAADGAFLVSVSDTGPGISEADQQKIFEEFQQADSSSTRKKGAADSGSRFPGGSWSCTAVGSGWNRPPARGLPSISRCRSEWSGRRREHEQACLGHRRPRGEPAYPAPPPDERRHRDDRGGDRRRRGGGGGEGAPGSHPHGHPAPGPRRLRGDAADQGQSRPPPHPDHRGHVLRAQRRRREGVRGRLRRLCHQALRPAGAPGQGPGFLETSP